jgi:hypothetical protein
VPQIPRTRESPARTWRRIAIQIEQKFAGQRKAFLAARHPDVYAEMELQKHLMVGLEAKQPMDQLMEHYQETRL